MKTQNQILFIVFSVATMALFSCKREKETDTFAADAQITQDQNQADNEVEDVASLQDDIMSRFGDQLMRVATSDSVMVYDSCATVTITRRGSNATGNILVDFGTTGCLGRDGRMRKGKIRFTFTERMRMPGAVITTTFENYAVKPRLANDYVMVDNSSNKVTTNVGNEITSANPIGQFRREINMRINFADGTSFTWAGTKNVAWNLGVLGNRWDNVYTLKSGSGLSGNGRNGTPYTVVVDQDVVRKAECALLGIYKPVSGQITIQHSNKTKTINYGNGSCDRSVTVTINGRSRTIRW
jgi:hypothetical protein